MKNNENNGFEFNFTYIQDPRLNENATERVNPIEYYGETYIVWFLSYLISGKGRPKRLDHYEET